MKYYNIFFLNPTNPTKITYKGTFHEEHDAKFSLPFIALDYVKSEQGSQQADRAYQNDKSLDEIIKNKDLKEGFYLKEDGDVVNLYEKKNIVIPGTIYNSYEIIVDKIGIFGISDLEVDDIHCPACTCFTSMPHVDKITTPHVSDMIKMLPQPVIDDLIKVHGKEKFGLRPVQERLKHNEVTKVKDVTVEFNPTPVIIDSFYTASKSGTSCSGSTNSASTSSSTSSSSSSVNTLDSTYSYASSCSSCDDSITESKDDQDDTSSDYE